MKYLVFLAILASCAMESYLLKEEELRPYKDMAQVTHIDKATKSIQLRSIQDSRQRPGIGMALTGVKYKKTPVVLAQDLNFFLKDYLHSELENRNVMIDRTSSLILDVVINELWVDEVVEKHQPEKEKCKVDLTFNIEMTNKKWSGQFWTEYTSAGDLTDGTERLAPTFASCLNEVVEKLVNHKEFLEIIK